MSNHSSPRLQLEIAEVGEAELDEGYEFMGRFGFDVAERWLAGIQATLQRECELHAAISMRRPLAIEHFPGRDVFFHTLFQWWETRWFSLASSV